jgi:hypothetical protein
MPGPVLSDAEIAQLKADQAKAVSAAATFTAQIAGQTAEAAKLAVSDGAFKKFFDYYNTNIISPYDAERRAIDGNYIASPVVEADIVSCASLAGGRIQPSLPATDVIRIAQFDGGPLVVDADHELQHISDQAATETTLVSGYGGSTPSSNIKTNTALTSSSTTLQLKNTVATFSIAANSIYIISDGTNLAVVKFLTCVVETTPTPPPFLGDCTIQLIVPPSGTIATNQVLTAFNGFTNSERTTKTASNPQLQPLMNYLVSTLQTEINARIANLNTQLTQIALNQDPDGTSQSATATTNVNTSKTFLTAYLVSTNVSDFGLGQLSTERGTRTTGANARVTQIISAYTNRTLNYYNERYNYANNRANTSRGTLRLQKNAEQSSATSAAFASTLAAQASAISGILP